jgi:hypothetical protein
MKKKVAVLVGGQYRHFDIAVKSWGPLIDYGCDFYFSTWETTQLKSHSIEAQNSLDNRTLVTKEMITKYIPNAEVCISIEADEPPEVKGNQLKMMAHWKRLIDMVKDRHYDALVVARSDLFFNPQVIDYESYFNNDSFNDNTLYGKTFIPLMQDEKYNNHLFDDVFFMGNFNTIKKFIKSIDILDPGAGASHYYLKSMCHSLNFNVVSIPTGEPVRNEELYAIVRPTVLNIDEDYYNYDNLKVCERYFGMIKYHI